MSRRTSSSTPRRSLSVYDKLDLGLRLTAREYRAWKRWDTCLARATRRDRRNHR